MTVFSCDYRLEKRPGHILVAVWVALALMLAPAVTTGQVDSAAKTGDAGPSPLFKQAIANQEQSEKELDQYERMQRQEMRKPGADPKDDTKTWRLFPMGTGAYKLPVSVDGTPVSEEGYRTELEKLEKYLVWVVQSGEGQKEAYAKAERKRKERFELLEATYQAFLFTPDGEEMRGGHTLLRYTLKPNPTYKPTSRNATIFTHVRGTLWIDKEASQLAKIDGTVIEDISLGLFLAKVYKGSHFMQERYEVAPEVWEPTFEQYDFDGRKFLYSFSIHERTFYSNYKRVGPPKEAVEAVRAELNKVHAETPAP